MAGVSGQRPSLHLQREQAQVAAAQQPSADGAAAGTVAAPLRGGEGGRAHGAVAFGRLDLDAQLAASHLALETALNEKAAAERTASSEIANLEMQLVEVRRAL